MSPHKTPLLTKYPRPEGSNSTHATNTATLAKANWKSRLTPGKLIEHEIAGVRQRLGDIERITREGVDQDGNVINAKTRSTWHKGTRKKIKKVLELIEKFSGDKGSFIEELQKLERIGLGGNILTGNN